jgi:hypothetical protein
MRFLSGMIVGIIVATVGFSGIARVLDHSVDAVKVWSKTSSTN